MIPERLFSLGLLVGLLACNSSYSLNEQPEQEGDDPGECSDLADNDLDGDFDCNDSGCANSPECCPDDDADGVCNETDVCADGDDAIDADGDGIADACDACPSDNPDDTDGDGVCDSADRCEGFDDTLDTDGDGMPDDCDPCPIDNPNDTDGDGVCESDDVCNGFDDNEDFDGDGAANGCDPCPEDYANDSDADGVCDSDDVCPGFDDAVDGDGDGVADGCDACAGYDDAADSDFDNVPDGCDACPGFDDAFDSDGDGAPDGCDACFGYDDTLDTDGDGVPNGCDACPGGDDSLDADGDGVPDACDPSGGSWALRFDGVDDYVEIPYDASMDTPVTGLTIEAWVYYDQFQSNCMTVLRRGTSQSASQEYWLHKSFSPADNLYWAGWSTWTVGSAGGAVAGAWFHYAGTWDPGAGTATIWLDGSALTTTAASATPPATVLEPSRIGIDWDFGCAMDGVLDEVRISSGPRYTTSFTPPLNLTPDGQTLALWNFDAGVGTTAFDSSGNGNHGTIVGATWTTEQP